MTEADFAPVVGGASSYQILLSSTAERRTRVDVLVVPASAPASGDLDEKRDMLATVLNGVDVDRGVRFVTPRDLQTSQTTNKTPAVIDTRQAARW
jgi:hypothetical protein